MPKAKKTQPIVTNKEGKRPEIAKRSAVEPKELKKVR
jgi:hypothetical protein